MASLATWGLLTGLLVDCNRWIAVRVDFVTALVMVSAGGIAVSKAGSISDASVGFSLTHATGLGALSTIDPFRRFHVLMLRRQQANSF